MSISITREVWRRGPRNRTEKFVLLAIAEHANDAGHAYPSIKRLSEWCTLSERSVISAVNGLEQRRWLQRAKKGRKTEYQIALAMLGISEAASPKKDAIAAPVAPIGEGRCTEQVKSTASIGEIYCKPPAPPYRKNHQEPSYEPAGETIDEAVHKIAEADDTLQAEPVMRALAKAIDAELEKGSSLDELIRVLPASWKKFSAARGQGKFEIGGWGPANFFAGGHWRDEQCWPWKPESRPERKRRYVDPAALYSGPEYQRRAEGA